MIQMHNEKVAYQQGFEDGVRDGRRQMEKELNQLGECEYNKGISDAIEKFSKTLKSRLTDAIYQKDVPSMSNLIDDVADEILKEQTNEV